MFEMRFMGLEPVATVCAVAPRRRRRCRGGGGSLSLTGEVEWVLGWVAGGDGRRMERIGVWDGKACACGSGGGG